MDKSRLIELRKKKIANKKSAEDRKHAELLDALSSLNNTLSDEPLKLESIQKILNELSEVSLFNKQMLELFNSINESLDKEVSIADMTSLLAEISKGDVAPVVSAIKNLSNAIIENKSQAPEDYIPVRRVRRVGKEYVFDDDASTPVVSVSGSGGGGVQLTLTRNNTTALAVVNPDGTPIAGASGVYIIRNISPPTDPEINTYKYFGFEDINTGSWRIMRKTLSNNIFMYDTGVSDYHTAWTNKSGGSYL